MAAIASTDVTVSLPPRDRDIVPSGPKLMSFPSITFGNGSLTYPAGGVPLPDKSVFGFKKQIDRIFIQQPAANGFVYKYDRANHKIKIFTQGAVTGSTEAGACGNGALIEDSAGSETVARLSGTAVDTAYDLGPLVELPAAIAPAAVTLELMAVGQ